MCQTKRTDDMPTFSSAHDYKIKKRLFLSYNHDSAAYLSSAEMTLSVSSSFLLRAAALLSEYARADKVVDTLNKSIRR